MKFAIAKEHRDFYQKHGLIEFEDFINQKQLDDLNRAIRNSYFNRASIEADKWHHQSFEQLFMNGRDLWRASDVLQKMTCLPRFAEIASELVEQKPLRLGYDQLFPSRHYSSLQMRRPSSYDTFLNQIEPLNETSSIEGMLCGLMLCLTPASEQQNLAYEPEGANVFAHQPGHAIFFQPSLPVDWKMLYHCPGQTYYLIVYTATNATYRLQPKDPHTHALKHLGYVLNTRLSDKLNPIVYR